MTPIFGRHTDTQTHTHTHTHTQAHWVTLRPDSVLISAIVVIHRHAVPLYIYTKMALSSGDVSPSQSGHADTFHYMHTQLPGTPQ